MRTPRRDFASPHSGQGSQVYYDLGYDKDLIEASFAAQYGIRLRQEPDMTLAEFFSLLSGIGSDTPLGRVVAVRMEKDPKVIKQFGIWEKGIRAEWIQFKSKNRSNKLSTQTQNSSEDFQIMLMRMFGG